MIIMPLPIAVSDAGDSCCGGPAPAETDACSVQDAQATAAGADGCGCRSAPGTEAPTPRSNTGPSPCCGAT
jgi:hypothetical protein